MLDELLLGGEIQETSKKNVLKAIAAQDLLQEVCKIYTWVMYYMTSTNRNWALLSMYYVLKNILNILPDDGSGTIGEPC